MSIKFIQITPETSQYCLEQKLSRTQYEVWFFLYHLDPFGDRPVPIPSNKELAIRLNMCLRSVQRAIAKFKKLGLFTIESNYQTFIQNAVKNQPLNTKNRRSRSFSVLDKNVATTTKLSQGMTKMSQPRQNCRKQTLQPNTDKGSISPQTNTDNIQTLSDIKGEENINSIANNQELVDFWFEDDVCNSSSIAAKDPDKGSIAAEVEILNENNHSEIEAELVDNDRLKDNKTATNSIAPVDWLPFGPWSIEGKLDPNFRDWLANEWIKEYGGTIAQKRANVLAYFHSKPAMLPVRWEQYRSEYLDRFTNAQTRMANGMSIDPTEQQQLIEHTAAVTNPLPPAMSPVAEKSGVRSQERRDPARVSRARERSPEGVKVTELIPQNNINDINNQLIPTSLTNQNQSLTGKLLTPDSELLTPNEVKGDRLDLIEIKALKAEEIEKASSSLNNQTLDNPSSHQEDRIPAKQKSESVIDFSALDRDEEIPENPDAYKLLTPEKIDNPASPSQLRDMFATIAERLKMKPPKSVQIKPENNLAKLNSWLADPILYPEAVQRAKKLGYSIEHNENGRAIAIYELDF